MNPYVRDITVGPVSPDVNVTAIHSDGDWSTIHVELRGETAQRLAGERIERIFNSASAEWLGGNQWALGYNPGDRLFS